MIDNENRAVSAGIFLNLSAGFFLILLKLVGLIEWSWLWVTLPLWLVPFGMTVAIVAVGQAVLLGIIAHRIGCRLGINIVPRNRAVLRPVPRHVPRHQTTSIYGGRLGDRR